MPVAHHLTPGPGPGRGTALARSAGPDLADLVAPAAILELWLEHPAVDLRLGISRTGMVYRSALALVRSGERAIGTVALRADDNGLVPAARIAQALSLFGDVADTLERTARELPMPRMTAVITTNGRAEAAVRAVGSVLRGTVVPDEVIVVDSGPRGTALGERLREWFPGEPVRLAGCPGAGRAAGRNAALAMARGDVVVFADDGIIADRDWLGSLVEALVACDADCATGQALPLDMDLEVHLDLERLTRAANGYFRRSVYRGADGAGDPFAVHPAGLSGSRRCLAVWREVAERVGGFDPRLGAGTPARGGEDLDFVNRLVEAGCTLVQEPGAIVWHEQRRTVREVRREAFSRGVGFSALFTKRLVEGPGRAELLRGIPGGVRDLVSSGGAVRVGPLESLQMAGIAFGPLAFARSWVSGRRRVVPPMPPRLPA